MKSNIICEAGKEFGFGHLSRCLSIYDEFSNNKIETRLIVNGDDRVIQFVKNREYLIFNWLKEQNKLFKILSDSEIIIIDSYYSDLAICQKFTNIAKACLFIDDINRIPYPNGFVLNAALRPKLLLYPKNKHVKYLFGTKYALLKKEIINEKTVKINENIKSILITYGGSDPRKLTLPTLKVLNTNFPYLFKRVIVDKSHPDLNYLIKLKTKKVEIIVSPKLNKLINAMKNSDIAVTAGGQTVLELLKLGIPTIAVVVADNQKLQIKGFLEKGAIFYAGDWKNKNLMNEIVKSLKKLENFNIRKKNSIVGKKLIDGKGANRIFKIILNWLIKKKTIKTVVRKVGIKDIRAILNISNQPEVRKSSFNSKLITLEQHKKWFYSKINDQNHLFFVAEFNKKVIGQIRLEMNNNNNNNSLISISVSNKYRKKRIGLNMFKYMIKYIKSRKLGIKSITAEIKKENTDSINFFRSIGFRYIKDISVLGNKAVLFLYKF